METSLIDLVSSYGIIGGAFLFMIWQNSKRERELMDFIKEFSPKLAEISTIIKNNTESISRLERSRNEHEDKSNRN